MLKGQMAELVLKSLLVILLLQSTPVLEAASLRTADSLVLSGSRRLAEEELIQLLREGSYSSPVILFRLAGLYHGCGMESRGLQVLDSLEQATGTDLLGWKISLLDLSRRSDEGLSMVAGADPLLSIWLQRDLEEIPLPDVIPAPDCMAQRAVRAMVCTDGRMSKGQVEQTVRDAVFLPFLVDEVVTELAICMKSEDEWWDRVASDLDSGHDDGSIDLLLADRDLHLCRGTETTWEQRLEGSPEIALMAADVLIRDDPEKWGRSWRLCDILIEGGLSSVAESLASVPGDPVFDTGIEMALLRSRGSYNQLLSLCDSLPSDLPDSLLARAALYRARAQRALQMAPDLYYDSYLQFASGFPWHSKASEAAYLAARYFASKRNWPRAADAYMIALRAGDFGGARAHWRGGFCHYMCGRGAVGDSIWASGIEEYPHSAWCDEMLFWRARYANRIGDGSLENQLLLEVSSRHPWEFYGLLASRRLGLDQDGFTAPEVNLTADPVVAEAVDMMSRGYGTMASEMLYATSALDPGVRSSVLALMGEHQRSLVVLRNLDYDLRDSCSGILPDSLLLVYFPAPYRELTQSVVSDMGVPAELVTGLMRQESYFNRWARSWVGATGLIQLMPGTAGDIARWYDLPPLSSEDFYDPLKSITYGSLYLARQYRAFDGSIVLTLCAYNAGPGNASSWMEEFPLEEGDPELFIEQIPLTETRGYVKHVMANSWIYGNLFR